MRQHLAISLTPGFSRVNQAPEEQKPFQRFLPGARETVETVSKNRSASDTWLKPGVNDSVINGPTLNNL